MAKNNKKILTEDLFNSEGNAKVDVEILNESKEEKQNEEIEDKIEENNNVVEIANNNDVTEIKIEEEKQNEEIKIKKSTSSVKNYGFNDESYYM